MAYCERLYYLEEVEQIRLADASVYAGREMHGRLERSGTAHGHRLFSFASGRLGLAGQVDAVHHREGGWIPYEHKRGRAKRGPEGEPEAWPSDALQVMAYALLIEEATGKRVREGRIRYHEDNATVRVPLTDEGRELVRKSVARAKELRTQNTRPPVNANENACIRCSLAPVCLPEEERLLTSPQWEPVRLFPATTDGEVVHLLTPSLRVVRSGEALVVKRKGETVSTYPIHGIAALAAHGNVQITTQALHLCAFNGVPVSWFTSGGRHISSLTVGPGSVQRRVRQYHALCDPATCLGLGRRLVRAKIEGQLALILRSSRGGRGRPAQTLRDIVEMRDAIKMAGRAEGIDSLRGIEGTAARAYFDALSVLVAKADPSLQLAGRTRRPPRDKFNAILSFGYSLLYASVLQGIVSVGLEPSLGFFHTPRSSGQPLALDVMELFRVPVWDVVVVGSVNRHQWDAPGKFEVTKDRVWLSDSGRREAIKLFEQRMESLWKHPVTGYSLSWRRTIELEVRLLEKEWSSTPGLFARARLR
ncbi:MAG: type I-MYXAN CRISPR-associated endonuclease Cas1 [Nitrososphaerota archaeon]|nr:type I-MYXAN CRISPR-associated endonuclease Cas1 [Nitrososphaerota archaeon]MDG7026373.1 type I-MYXAN CRISPR-associated endonuclease Cas1 [Nitrososphaerota archaeon]